jgi:hypothetical protein
VLQVLGVLAAGLLIAVIARGRLPAARQYAISVAITTAIAASLLFWGHVWSAGKAFNAERKDLADVSSFDSSTSPGANGGVNVQFLAWAKRQMRAGDSFALVPSAARRDPFTYQWSTYQLTPHRQVSAADADWLVFYGAPPGAVAFDTSRFGKPRSYETDFAVARRQHAG